MDIVGYEQRVQDLDHRQDDVLERLEELDRRLVSLIEIWAPRRDTKAVAAAGLHSHDNRPHDNRPHDTRLPDEQSHESGWHDPFDATEDDESKPATSTPNRRSAA